MPAYFTLLLEEIDKLLGNAKEEVTIMYLCFPVSQIYNPPILLHVSNPSGMIKIILVEEVMILFYRSFIYNITLAQMNLTTHQIILNSKPNNPHFNSIMSTL